MRIKFDFQLSHHFGVVERILFNLVLNGFTDVQEIREAIPIFSDVVLANGMKHLVNKQILNIGIDNNRLSISEPIRAIICSCIENTFDIEVEENIKELITVEGVSLDSVGGHVSKEMKISILNTLVPNVNLHLYRNSIDIILLDADRGNNNG